MNPRRVSGLKAKRQGEVFEQMFLLACKRSQIACTRFPDGCKRIAGRGFGGNALIQIKTPWDWILTLKGDSAFIDTKNCLGASFPHSKIEPHQIVEMLAHESQGAVAGYVIWLREIDQVLFASARRLHKLIGVRGSLSLDSGVMQLGHSNVFDPERIFL